jgi:hypothetical protein
VFAEYGLLDCLPRILKLQANHWSLSTKLRKVKDNIFKYIYIYIYLKILKYIYIFRLSSLWLSAYKFGILLEYILNKFKEITLFSVRNNNINIYAACVSDREREDLEAHERRQLHAPICKLLIGQTNSCLFSCPKVNLKHDNIKKDSHAYKIYSATGCTGLVTRTGCTGLVTRTQDSAVQVPFSTNDCKSPTILFKVHDQVYKTIKYGMSHRSLSSQDFTSLYNRNEVRVAMVGSCKGVWNAQRITASGARPILVTDARTSAYLFRKRLSWH